MIDFQPFDRIVVTVQAADIPSSWVHQLAQGGRLIVPLRMRGMTRTIAFVRDGHRLVSDGFELCGFVPMQGAGENRMQRAVAVPLGLCRPPGRQRRVVDRYGAHRLGQRPAGPQRRRDARSMLMVRRRPAPLSLRRRLRRPAVEAGVCQ
ncbi:hypothetical protein OHU89_51070 [Streptomyces sp. NBC_00019]